MYLTCCFCPSQAFPVPTDVYLQLGQGLQKYQCAAKHIFYVEQEREQEIEPESAIHVHKDVL